MPARKTNFIPFACFGYFDENYDECKNCKKSVSCNNETNSTEYEEVRKIFKYKVSQIEELDKKWKNKK